MEDGGVQLSGTLLACLYHDVDLSFPEEDAFMLSSHVAERIISSVEAANILRS